MSRVATYTAVVFLSTGALPARGADVPFTERAITEDPDGPGGLERFADRPASVFATDLDADGDIDVLSASFNDGKIAWYENLCQGRFDSLCDGDVDLEDFALFEVGFAGPKNLPDFALFLAAFTGPQ